MADLNLTGTPYFNSDGLSVSASHNPITFTFETNQIGSANYAYLWLYVQGPTISAGASLTFNGRTYTASDDPEFGEFLTTAANTRLEVAQSLMLTLRDDPNNYQYEFQVISTGFMSPSVFAMAKKTGAAYNVTASVSVGSNLTIFQVFNGTDQYRGQALESYKIWANLITNDGFLFASYLNSVPSFSPGNKVLAMYDLKWASDNKHYIDVSGVCNSQVNYEAPNTAIGIYRQQSPLKAFFVEYGESYIPTGNENEIRKISGRTSMFYVLNSALPTLTSNDLRGYYQRGPLQKFLTEQPISRQIRVTDTSWLSFLFYSPNAVSRWIGIQIYAFYYDGTSANVGIFSKTQMSNGYHTARIDPASWGMTSHENSTGKLVEHYEVYLVESLNAAFTSTTKFTEARTFTIDRLCPSDGLIQFAWLETIGGWTGYSFFGESTTDVNRDASVFQRGRKNVYAITDQMETVKAIDFEYQSVANSGAIDLTTFRWLRESLLKSAAVYLVSGSQLFPIIILSHQAKSSTNDFVFGMSITYKLSAPVTTIHS